MSAETKPNLLDLDRKGLEGFFLARGEKVFRASQIMKWIYERGVTDFADMTNLSKALRHKLSQSAMLVLPEVIADQVTPDGTRKWLLRLEDGNSIETVFIPEKSRGTLCVSSQVGCGLNCSFCATARQGFNRNLSAAEIVGQLLRRHAAGCVNAIGGDDDGGQRLRAGATDDVDEGIAKRRCGAVRQQF